MVHQQRAAAPRGKVVGFRELNDARSPKLCPPGSKGGRGARRRALAGLAVAAALGSVSWAAVQAVQLPVTGSWTETCDFPTTNCAVKGKYHLGDDVLRSAGTAVYASADGVVKHAKVRSGYGLVVIIEHDLGNGKYMTTLYGHMRDSDKKVVAGQTVKKGQLLGYLGNSSENGGWTPHIHWGARPGPYAGDNATTCGGEWVYGGYTACSSTVNEWVDPSDWVAAFKPFVPESPQPVSWQRTSPLLTRDARGIRCAPFTTEAAIQCVITQSDGTLETFRLNLGASTRPRGTVDFPPTADLARFGIKVSSIANIVEDGDAIVIIGIRADNNQLVAWRHTHGEWARDSWVTVTGVPALTATVSPESDAGTLKLSGIRSDGATVICTESAWPAFSCQSFSSPYKTVGVATYDPTGARSVIVSDVPGSPARWSTFFNAPPTSWISAMNPMDEAEVDLASWNGKVYVMIRSADGTLHLTSARSSNITEVGGSYLKLVDGLTDKAATLVGTSNELVAVFVGRDKSVIFGTVLKR